MNKYDISNWQTVEGGVGYYTVLTETTTGRSTVLVMSQDDILKQNPIALMNLTNQFIMNALDTLHVED